MMIKMIKNSVTIAYTYDEETLNVIMNIDP